MKFNCDRYRDYRKAKIAHITKWHPWFAWHPIKIADGDCRWLETIERKFNCGRTYFACDFMVTEGRGWEYRSPT